MLGDLVTLKRGISSVREMGNVGPGVKEQKNHAIHKLWSCTGQWINGGAQKMIICQMANANAAGAIQSLARILCVV